MKKRVLFKSIYARFAVTFLMIWWFLNSLTFAFVLRIIMPENLLENIAHEHYKSFIEFERIRRVTGITFFISAIIGTIIILIVVRGIVKPLKRLSTASKEVAKGNFDIEVKITNTDEIGRLIGDFNKMTKELKNIDILRKDFVSSVSHEFKTPITSIKGYAKLIKSGKLSNEQICEYSEIIESESQRLSLLSSNLLRLSELDSKVIREPASLFSLDEQIRKCILILESQWNKKDIDLDIELEEIFFWGDELLLQQAWINLIQNAIKFSNPKGTIKINLQKKDTIVKIDVIDNGIGIAEEDKEKIFKRFYKSDKSRSKEGNGLGLVIVKKIIELSRGKIYFESQQGKGSVFTVELPI
ncbi:MAG: sensor histidine kinase [Eubacteriaceae bacterium]